MVSQVIGRHPAHHGPDPSWHYPGGTGHSGQRSGRTVSVWALPGQTWLSACTRASPQKGRNTTRMIWWLLRREIVTSWFLPPNHSLKEQCQDPKAEAGLLTAAQAKRSHKASTWDWEWARMPVPEQLQLLELWALGHDCQHYGCQDRVQKPKAPTERPAVAESWQKPAPHTGPPPAHGTCTVWNRLAQGEVGRQVWETWLRSNLHYHVSRTEQHINLAVEKLNHENRNTSHRTQDAQWGNQGRGKGSTGSPGPGGSKCQGTAPQDSRASQFRSPSPPGPVALRGCACECRGPGRSSGWQPVCKVTGLVGGETATWGSG